MDVAGRRGLAALVSYVRATAVVATVDALAIGIALAVLGVPLAVPLAALVFLGAFIPIIGAVVAGGVAVMIALVAQGLVSALIVLGVVIAVMQLESHVLQPLLLGRAVKLHPLAVVLSIATGLLVGGIAGALLAVPLLAVLNSGIRSLLSEADEHVDPEDVHTSEPEDSGRTSRASSGQPDLRPDDAAVDSSRGGGCSAKKRTISADASGPAGSVYEPPATPPDQAWPEPCTVHSSPTTAPSRRTTTRVAGRPGPRSTSVSPRTGPPRELLDDAGGVAGGDGRVGVAVEGDHRAPAGPAAATRGAERMAAKADATSVAQPCGSPECTPTAANTSGYAAPSTAAIAAPAENPATYTRSRSTACSAAISSTIPARIDGSPAPRRWSAGSNQFQYRIGFAEVTCSG